MATFKSVLSRRIVAASVLLGSALSVGAAFAPTGPSFQPRSDLVGLMDFRELRTAGIPFDGAFSGKTSTALDRLGELVLTHRAIAVSA